MPLYIDLSILSSCLFLQESNRQHIEHVLSGAIIKSKMLTPHQTGQLILFMVDHSKVIFEDPPQLEQALMNTSHGSDVPTPGKTHAIFVKRNAQLFQYRFLLALQAE